MDNLVSIYGILDFQNITMTLINYNVSMALVKENHKINNQED